MKNATELWNEGRQKSEYWSDLAKLNFAIELNAKMEEKKVSRASLAHKIAASKSYISKILGGYANFTIESMSKLAFALGLQIKITFSEIDGKPNKLTGALDSVFSESSRPVNTQWGNEKMTPQKTLPQGQKKTYAQTFDLDKVAA